MIRQCCLDAYGMGMVILACIHIDNPLTGGDSWDNSSTEVAKQLLTSGSATNTKFNTWLDRLAQFAQNLKGSNGELIPIILRPFHEHTDGWSWWGSTCTTKDEYIALWQYTVKYLRDTKGVHNFLYAISPDMNSRKTEDDVLFRWPGDSYVDFIGIDSYIGLNNDVFVNNLKMLVNVSKAKMKPCGVTETGVQGFTATDYWTTNILAPMTGREVSMLVTWTNEYAPADLGDHYFSVYSGHPSAADFVKMYNSDITYFRKDLPNMYTLKDGYVVQ
jgi:mannan endo-1,4-beta-mannosidase